MVIDADEEFLFQAVQASALKAVALQDDRGFVVSIYALRLHYPLSEREALINARHGIVQDYDCFFAQAAQRLPAGQCRTNGVTVRSSMRCEHESAGLLEMFKHFV